jgi:hypothetical protein
MRMDCGTNYCLLKVAVVYPPGESIARRGCFIYRLFCTSTEDPRGLVAKASYLVLSAQSGREQMWRKVAGKADED